MRTNFSPRMINSGTVVFIGMSTTQGTGVLSAEAWPALVGDTRNYKTTVNSGIGGNLTSQMLARYETDVLAHYPGLVCIESWPNNASVVDAEADFRAMLTRSQIQGSHIVLFQAYYNRNVATEAVLAAWRPTTVAMAADFDAEVFDTFDDISGLSEAELDLLYLNDAHPSVAGHENIKDIAIAQGMFTFPLL